MTADYITTTSENETRVIRERDVLNFIEASNPKYGVLVSGRYLVPSNTPRQALRYYRKLTQQKELVRIQNIKNL